MHPVPSLRSTSTSTSTSTSDNESGCSTDVDVGSLEVSKAIELMVQLIQATNNAILSPAQLSLFQATLSPRLLASITSTSWSPANPSKGSAARCVLIANRKLDPVISLAVSDADIPVASIQAALPQDLAVWIDPGSVSYRLGSDHAPVSAYWEHPSMSVPPKSKLFQRSLAYSPPPMSSAASISPSTSPQLYYQQMSAQASPSSYVLPQKTKVTMRMPSSVAAAAV